MIILILTIYYVYASDNHMTCEEKYRTYQEITTAVTWWKELSPLPIEVSYTETKDIITATPETIYSWGDKIQGVQSTRKNIAVYVVKTDSTVFTGTQSPGQSSIPRRSIFLIYNQMNFDAAMAHEFGHVVFKLPDWYIKDPDYCRYATDIMCYHAPAYTNKTIGRKSYEYIGGILYRQYIPTVQSQD